MLLLLLLQLLLNLHLLLLQMRMLLLGHITLRCIPPQSFDRSRLATAAIWHPIHVVSRPAFDAVRLSSCRLTDHSIHDSSRTSVLQRLCTAHILPIRTSVDIQNGDGGQLGLPRWSRSRRIDRSRPYRRPVRYALPRLWHLVS